MAASRRQAAVVVVGMISLALAACDSLLGLGQYQDVACAPDCDSGTKESGTGPSPDAAGDVDAATVIESGTDADAGADADADAGVITVPDAGWPVPSAHEVWAHWKMPNPDDAAISSESSTQLPNPMSYDAGADGGSMFAYDAVTKLTWLRLAAPATTYDKAWEACQQSGDWRVPTRIELVSLIDFTQPSGSPTIDPTVFPSVKAQPTWTASAVAGAGAPTYWVVDFATGLTGYGGGGLQVLCVNGGTP
jgi:hypothetical protein